jgi:hypothetical protein
MTAYRQRARLPACAVALQVGPLRPRDLRASAPDSGAILLRNVYGWFERIKPGVYRPYLQSDLEVRQHSCSGKQKPVPSRKLSRLWRPPCPASRSGSIRLASLFLEIDARRDGRHPRMSAGARRKGQSD